MKFKVFKVESSKQQNLVYQLDVKDEAVRPGTWAADLAAKYVEQAIPHKTADSGTSPLLDSNGVYLTKWLILDDAGIYWFIPGGKFKKEPIPITIS